MVQAANQNYGNTYVDSPRTYTFVTTYTNNAGTPASTSGTVTVRDHRCQRENHTKNPVIVKQGLYPWREPSNYIRIIIDYDYTPAEFAQTEAYGRGLRTRTYKGYYSISISHIYYLWTYPMAGGGNTESLLSEKNQARTECLLKLKEGKVNIGTALAESVQSYNMLADSAKDLFGLLLAIKRGKFPNTTDLRGALQGRKAEGIGRGSLGVANGYLQVKYGWQPLMSDIKGLYDEFVGTTSAPPIISAKRNIKSKWHSDSKVDYWVNRSQVIDATNTCEIWARLKSEFIQDAVAHGLVNPLSLAWELVPYSFVVDWAMPIGNVLEALTAKAGLDFIGGYEAQRMTGTVKADRTITSGYSGHGVGVTAKSFTYYRYKLNGFPTPLPYVKSPFSTSNGLSALALWRQLIS